MDFAVGIVDTNPEFCGYAFRAFRDVVGDEVQIINQDFLNVDFDCFVWPGNPYGLISSGIDNAICSYFGDKIFQHLKSTIDSWYNGKQPPGSAILLETSDPSHPYLIYTPCFPKREESSYLAMKAALQEIHQYNSNEASEAGPEKGGKWKRPIRSVVCPGLGTYLGMVPYDVQTCATQMALAYAEYKQDTFSTPKK
eukprot:TRINITY_DN23702_c0_g1_i1.p1 TRINITY_DN23702_c0_g1~~TRINITY_DN23702_c0_g1_i1.p1  ORF type:complete len:196 (-),score=50.05 TRINITY_DN23702_c0_g1_i1:130-717(-)